MDKDMEMADRLASAWPKHRIEIDRWTDVAGGWKMSIRIWSPQHHLSFAVRWVSPSEAFAAAFDASIEDKKHKRKVTNGNSEHRPDELALECEEHRARLAALAEWADELESGGTLGPSNIGRFLAIELRRRLGL